MEKIFTIMAILTIAIMLIVFTRLLLDNLKIGREIEERGLRIIHNKEEKT